MNLRSTIVLPNLKWVVISGVEFQKRYKDSYLEIDVPCSKYKSKFLTYTLITVIISENVKEMRKTLRQEGLSPCHSV